MVEGIDLLGEAVGIDMDDEIEAELGDRRVAKADHVAEFPGRIDMHQRKGRLRRIESLHGQMQHHG